MFALNNGLFSLISVKNIINIVLTHYVPGLILSSLYWGFVLKKYARCVIWVLLIFKMMYSTLNTVVLAELIHELTLNVNKYIKK